MNPATRFRGCLPHPRVLIYIYQAAGLGSRVLLSRTARNITLASLILSLAVTKATPVVASAMRRMGLMSGLIISLLSLYYAFEVIEFPVVQCKRTSWNIQLLQKDTTLPIALGNLGRPSRGAQAPTHTSPLTQPRHAAHSHLILPMCTRQALTLCNPNPDLNPIPPNPTAGEASHHSVSAYCVGLEPTLPGLRLSPTLSLTLRLSPTLSLSLSLTFPPPRPPSCPSRVTGSGCGRADAPGRP